MNAGATRPLAQQIPRRDDRGLAFEVDGREVVVGGDVDAAWNALALCDGRLTVDEIVAHNGGDEEVRDLLAELLRLGALVDCTQAYRLLHRRASAGSPMFRTLTEEEIAALLAERFAPARIGGDPVPLAVPDSVVLRAAGARRSAVPGERRPVSFEDLSAVVAATHGELGGRRAVPSAGGIYPLIVHVAIRRPLGPLGDGVWWYDVASSSLRRTLDETPDLGEVILSQEICDELLEAGEPVVFLSADLERPSRKYANRGYRYALIEVGAAMQNSYLVAAERALPIRAIGGIHDANADRLLDLDERRSAILALLLGS